MFPRAFASCLCIVVISVTAPLPLFSQVSTNIGNEFWIAFPPNFNTATLQIFISSDFSTSGTVTSAYPGVDQDFTVVPGVVTQLAVPIGVTLQSGVENKGIHIVAADPVAVYALSWMGGSTDAYMALPVSSLDIDYRILTFPTTLENMGSALSVVATENNTVLTVYNHQTNGTTIINLDQGQTYHVASNTIDDDLTGSRVQSNRPVSVFGSVKATYIPQGCNYADHVIEQMWPVSSWGKRFVTVPLAGRDGSGDIFRVLASADGTDVSVNGTPVATLSEGEVYMANLTGYNSVTTSKACCLAQYAKGISCTGGTTGDPFMMLIPPREQFLTHYTIGTVAGFTSHWVNIVAPDYAQGAIYEDGILIPESAFIPVGTTNYSGAQRSITAGSHTFTSIFPFGVFVYGWTNVNSYGYPGGGSLSPVGTIAGISLSPDYAIGELNVTNLCFTAHVTDDFLNPVEGVLVNFYISGINPITGNAYTNALGDAVYCYTQTGVTAGTDLLYAEVFGFTSDTSTVEWTYIPPCVNPTNGGTIGNSQSGCSGFTPSVISGITPPVGYTGELEYKWQQSVTGAGSGYSDIMGSNTPFWTPGPLTQTTWYRRLARVNCVPGWTDAALSNVVEITAIPLVLPQVTITVSENPVCQGTSVTCTATPVNGGLTPLYQWQVNGVSSGTNNPIYTYDPASGDVVSCLLTSSEQCTFGNPATSNAIAIILNPLPLVSFQPCFDTITTIQAIPFQLKGGIPYGGTYSGPGVNSLTGVFTPSVAGPGISTVTYSMTNTYFCTATKTRNIVVQSVLSFTCGDNLTDVRDNQVYPTIQIGTQCWMAANLNYGTMIPSTIHQRDNCLTEKYCSNNLIASCTQNGAAYQWDEIMRFEDVPGRQGLCPPGWHVPTEADWNTLMANWTNSAFAGSPLKYTGYSGFNAQLSGVSHINRQWDFTGFATFFWSSTPCSPVKAWAHGMNEDDPSVSLYPSLRSNAFFVRCLRN